jgi:hypothetical protein
MFMKLIDCPDCGEGVQLVFDDGVALQCTGCGRKFGVGTPEEDAHTMCYYWNALLGER